MLTIGTKHGTPTKTSFVKPAWLRAFIPCGIPSLKKRRCSGNSLPSPKQKVTKAKAASKIGTDFFWVDPRDKDEVLTVLKLAGAGVDDPDVKVALQKATNQISGGRKLDLEPPLDDLPDAMAFITVILALYGDHEVPSKALKACKKADEELAGALEAFHRVSQGTVENWDDVMALDREDSLTTARRTLAWQHAPAEAEACTSEQLDQGLRLLEAANIHEGRDRLTWWRLNALLREGKKDEAMDVLDKRRLDANSDVTELLPLVVSLDSERANDWLMRFMDAVDEQALLHVLRTEELVGAPPLEGRPAFVRPARTDVGRRSQPRHRVDAGSPGHPSVGDGLASDSMLPLTHPYVALLVSHVAPATVEANLRAPIVAARSQALQSIHGAEVPEVLSPLAEHLLLLMEGIYKDTLDVVNKLNAAAVKAFSPISRALAEEGVVSATHIPKDGEQP